MSDTRNLITSLRIEPLKLHASVWIWTRGGLSGQLTVRLEDVDALIDRLQPDRTEWVEPIHALEPGPEPGEFP
jgi:hypothetical protein